MAVNISDVAIEEDNEGPLQIDEQVQEAKSSQDVSENNLIKDMEANRDDDLINIEGDLNLSFLENDPPENNQNLVCNNCLGAISAEDGISKSVIAQRLNNTLMRIEKRLIADESVLKEAAKFTRKAYEQIESSKDCVGMNDLEVNEDGAVSFLYPGSGESDLMHNGVNLLTLGGTN